MASTKKETPEARPWVIGVELPPMRRRGRPVGPLMEFVEALKAQPGQWGQYRPGHGHISGSTTVRRLRDLGCEATLRSWPADPKRCDIYARWPEQ